VNWVATELLDFGRRIGLPQLALDQADACQLKLESGALIALELVDEELIIYRCQPLPWPDPALLLRALRRCNTREGGTALQIGLRGTAADTKLIVALRLPAREFTAQRLEASWEMIQHWIEDCAGETVAR